MLLCRQLDLFGRVLVRHDGQVVAEHVRQFGRDRTVFDPWHYLPVLLRKPGALRNGAPFQDWPLPPALERLRRALGRGDQADRAFVAVLAAVSRDGIDAVASACAEASRPARPAPTWCSTPGPNALAHWGPVLALRREPPRPGAIAVPPTLLLAVPPTADCACYDRLRPSSVAPSDAETERAAA